MKIVSGICSYRISNGALAGRDLPTRIKFLDWGSSKTTKGPVSVSALTAESLPKVQALKGWDRVALDYEHNTLKGSPEFERSTEPRAVAAFGTVVCVPGDGMYLEGLEWTPHGKTYAREYVDLSPAPLQADDGQGTVVGVHSVALCRHGAVEGLHFYSIDVGDAGIKSVEGEKMDWKKWLIGLLGVPEDTADADLMTAFKAKITAMCAEAVKPISDSLAALQTKITAFSAEGGGGAEAVKTAALIAAAEQKIVALSADVDSMKAGMVQRDRDSVCAQAAREGKVIPLSAEQIGKLAVEDLREIVGKLSVTVPIDQRTPERIAALSADTPSTALETVARLCGMDPKAVLEHSKKQG